MLDHLRQRYLYYADSGAITKGTVNLIVLAPLSDVSGFMDPPYQVRGEQYVRFEIEDGPTTLEGLMDVLLMNEQLWLIVIESKRYGFSVRQAIAHSYWHRAAPSCSNPATAGDSTTVTSDFLGHLAVAAALGIPSTTDDVGTIDCGVWSTSVS